MKQRRKVIKQERLVLLTNKLVQFAIEKDFVFMDAIRQRPWNKVKKLSATLAVQGYIGVTTLGTKLFGSDILTMSGTERNIRSISFVIGLNRAQAAGLMRQDIPWYEFTDTKDINEAITIGRNYQERINFGLSTQAMGEYSYGGWGGLQGKFKYWSVQKFGSDVRLFSEAYASVKSLGKIESNSFDIKALVKMFKIMLTNRGKTLKTTNPEIAALRNFFLSQLPLTVATDLLTFGLFPPFAGARWLKGLMYYGSGGKALRGFTSDLVSLSISPLIIMGLIFKDSGFEDEEEWDRVIKYYMRKTFFGFVPMWAFDNIVWMIMLMGDASKKGYEGLIDSTSVFRGGNLPWNKAANQYMKSLIED